MMHNILRRIFPRRVHNIFSNLAGTNVNDHVALHLEQQIQLTELISTEKVIEIDRLELLDYENIEEIQQKLEPNGNNIKLLTIFIDEISRVPSHDDIQILAEKCINQSIVIMIKLRNTQKLNIFWKSTEIQHFVAFKHYSLTFSEKDEIIYNFIADFLANCLSKGHLGIIKEIEVNQDLKEIELKQLANSYGLQLIHIASSEGKAEIVKMLLNLGCKTESIIKGLNAQICAMANGRSKVLLLFAQNNFIYPENIDPGLLSNEFNEFYKTTEELHEAIKSKDNEKVSQILESDHQKLKFYFNYQNQSAAQIAINNRDFHIYENLIVHDVFFSPHEIKNDCYERLDLKTKKVIRELHKKHSKDHPDNHINILMTNTYSAHDSMNFEQNLELVKEAYKDLSKNSFCDAMLKIVAASNSTELYYDFMRSKVNSIDPTSSSDTQGIFYPCGQIFIGAELLLEESTRNQAMAIMAHELCHCAMNLVYRNDANPYEAKDKAKKREFERINQICKEFSETEKIINVIYKCYPKEVYHAELVVRYCHSEILYKDNPEKLEQNRQVFKELWKFAESTVLPDMIEAVPKVKNREKFEIDKLRRTVTVTILIALITVFGLILVGYLFFYNPNYKFNDLTSEDKIRVKNGIVNYNKVEVRFSDLFPENSTVYSNLASDHISQIFSKNSLNFSDPHFGYLSNQVNLGWTNLTEKLKDKFLTETVRFQNESLTYERLLDIAPNSLKYLTSEQISQILSGKTLELGKLIPNTTEFYNERTFRKKIEALEWNEFHKDQGRVATSKMSDQLIAKYYVHNITKDKSIAWSDLYVEQSFPVVKLSRKQNISHTISETFNSRFMILSDEAGSGKTVTFRDLTIRIKKNYPTWWVSYVDLKDFTKYYNSSGNLEDLDELLENILDLKSKSDFDREVFKEMFSLGRVVLLWNGFDEISPTFNKFIEKVMVSIFINSTNVQFVCTRPLYAEQLEKTFNMQAFGLFPYTNDEQKEFLEKYFVSENVNRDRIDNLVESVHSISVEQKFTTPLMLKLIAEVYKDKSLQNKTNLYEIYEAFVRRKVQIWQEKSDYVKNLTSSFLVGNVFDIIKIYQKFALLSEYDNTQPVMALKIIKQQIPPDFPLHEITRMGILYINSETEFEFAHKTFPEFFVAQYFISNLYQAKNEDEFQESILNAFYYLRNQDEILNFLINFLDSETSKESFSPNFVQLLTSKHKNMFIEMLYEGKPTTFEMLFKFFSKDKKLLAKLLKVDEDETLYTANFNYRYKAENIDPHQIRDLARNFLTEDDFKRFVSGRNQKGKILFGMSFYRLTGITKSHSYYSLDSFDINEEFLLNFYENVRESLTEGEQKELLIFLIGNPKVFYSISSFQFLNYEKIWRVSEKMLTDGERKVAISMALSAANDFGGLNFVQDYSKILDFLFTEADELMKPDEIFEIFVGNKILHRATLFKHIFRKIWNFFVSHTDESQQRKLLIQKDFIGKIIHTNDNGESFFNFDFNPFTIFDFSLFNRIKFGSFEVVADIYEKYFNKTGIQNMIIDSNEFLPHMITNTDKRTCEKFAEFLEIIFNGQEDLLINFLSLNVGITKLSIFEYFQYSKSNVDDSLNVFEVLNNFAFKWISSVEKLQLKFGNENFTFFNRHSEFSKLSDFNSAFHIDKTFSKKLNVLDLETFYKSHELDYRMATISGEVIANYYVESINKDPSLYWTDLNVEQTFPDIKIGKKLSTSEIISETLRSRFMILSDEAGAITLRDLAIRIKINYHTRWVSYVDLKDFSKFYNSSGNLEDLDDLLEKILDLKSKSDFDREVSKEMFSLGRVVLLWNGFDEISPIFNKFIEKVMVSIFINSTNVQFVCTRPLYAEQLEKTFNMQAFGLFPYTNDEQKEFLEKYFVSENVNRDRIDNLVESVHSISVEQKFTTPLMLKLIAEVYKDKSLQNKTNLYEIYEAFVRRKVQIWQEKSDYVKNLTSSFLVGNVFDIIKIYQKFALLSEYDNTQPVMALKIIKQQIPPDFPLHEITRMGILYINSETEFEFAHKTFPEFFVAQYFISNLYQAKNEDEFQESILNAFYYLRNQDEILNFLINFLDSETSKESFSPNFVQLLTSKHKNMFIEMLYEGKPTTFEMLFKFFSKDKKLLAKLLKVDEDETLYTANFNYRYKAENIDPHQIRDLARNFLTEDDFKRFVSGRNQKGKILFGMSFYRLTGITKSHSYYSLDSFDINEEFLLNFYENVRESLTEGEQKELLIFLIGNPKVFYSISSFQFLNYEKIWRVSEKMLTDGERKVAISMALSAANDFGGLNFVQDYSKILDFLFTEADELMKPDEIFEIFVGNKILHRATLFKHIFRKIWNFFVSHTDESQQRKLLIQKDFIGKIIHTNDNGESFFNFDFNPFTIFDFSLFNRIKFGSFEVVADIYEKYFNKTGIQNMIIDSNEFLPHMITNTDKRTCEKFAEFLEIIFNGQEDLLINFLSLNVGITKLSIFEYFQYSKSNVDDSLNVFEVLNNFAFKWISSVEKLQLKFGNENFTFIKRNSEPSKLSDFNSAFHVDKTFSKKLNVLDLETFYKSHEWDYRLATISDEVIANYYVESINKDPSLYWTDLNVEQTFPDIKIGKKLSTPEIISETLRSRFMILSDEAGAVTLRDLTVRIKKNYHTRWVSYVDLKDFTKFYNSSGNLEDLDDLLEKIIDLQSKSDFDREVFKEMFILGRIVLLWNGFDEISPTFNKFIENLMLRIFINTTNVQFVCTRPLYAEQLEKTFNSTSYELLSYTEEEVKEFLEKYFIAQSINNEQVKILVKEVFEIAADWNGSNTLIMNALAHTYQSLQNSNENEKALKLSVFYVYQAFLESLSKSLHQEENFSKIKKQYQKSALLSCFPFVSVKRLKIMEEKSDENSPRTELMLISSNNKKFRDFFAAQFFIQNFYLADDQVDFDENIFNVFYYSKNYGDLLTFMIHFLDAQPKTGSGSFSSEFTSLVTSKHKNMFIDMLYNSLTTAYEMLFKFFSKDKKLLAKLLKVNEDETLYTAIYNFRYWAQYIDPHQISDLAQRFLPKEDFKRFISGRNQKGKILFGMALYKTYNIIKPHHEYSLDSFDINLEFVLNFDENFRGNLTQNERKELLIFIIGNPKVFYFLGGYTFSHFENVWREGEKILTENERKLAISSALSTADFGSFVSIQRYSEVLDFLFQKAEKLMNQSEIFEMFKDRQILHQAALYKEIFRKFWKFFLDHSDQSQQKEILTRADCFGRVDYTTEDGGTLYYSDFTSFTIFQFSLFSRVKFGSFEVAADIYEKYFDKTQIQNMILKSNEFLPHMVSNTDKATCEKFTEFLERIFDGNKQALIKYLNLKIGRTQYTLSNYFDGLDVEVDESLKVFFKLLA